MINHRLTSCRWEIQHFVKHEGYNSADPYGRISTLFELDRRLEIVFENFHADLQYHQAGSFASSKVDPYQLFSIHGLYRLCACTLHTSIVPLFSESPSTPWISKKLVRMSAEESVKHALLLLDMASSFLAIRPDISRLPSISGYAMFVACTVHFKSLVAQSRLQKYGTNRVKGAVCVLEQLKAYWATNQDLVCDIHFTQSSEITDQDNQWDTLKNLYASKGIDINTISKSDNRFNASSHERDADLEKIVSHEGTSQVDQSVDIYTYIASQESKVSSQRRSSNTSSTVGRTLAQSTLSPPNSGKPGPVAKVSPVQKRDKDPKFCQASSDSPTFNVPYQQQSHDPGRRLESQITEDTPTHPASVPNNVLNSRRFSTNPSDFVWLGNVAEEDRQTQGNSADRGYVQPEARMTAGQSTNILGELEGYLATNMDIDGVDLWWDRSFEAAFWADSRQVNPMQDLGTTYNHQNCHYNQ